MKKLFLLLLSVLGLLGSFFVERGTLVPFISLITATVLVPLFFGVICTTLFSYHFKEIANTFKTAFSEETNFERLKDYRKNLLIVKNLQSSTAFWSGTIVIIATVNILSGLTTPNKLGHSLAIALSALFFGFALKAMLFIPMEHSLNKKIVLAEDN